MLDEYASSASVYDAIYESMKDYRVEANRVHSIIEAYRQTNGRSLLDVACGTGLHAQYLCDRYNVEGVDTSAAMLAIARRRLPQLRFHQADMTELRRGRQYDVVTCLFSAIAHLQTAQRLRAAIACMARHLKTGGVLFVEPFIAPRSMAGRGGEHQFRTR